MDVHTKFGRNRFNAYETYGRFISKKFEIFDIGSGLLKNFLRHRLPKENWPGNVVGQSPKRFSKITLFLFIGGKQSLVESRVEIFF